MAVLVGMRMKAVFVKLLGCQAAKVGTNMQAFQHGKLQAAYRVKQDSAYGEQIPVFSEIPEHDGCLSILRKNPCLGFFQPSILAIKGEFPMLPPCLEHFSCVVSLPMNRDKLCAFKKSKN